MYRPLLTSFPRSISQSLAKSKASSTAVLGHSFLSRQNESKSMKIAKSFFKVVSISGLTSACWIVLAFWAGYKRDKRECVTVHSLELTPDELAHWKETNEHFGSNECTLKPHPMKDGRIEFRVDRPREINGLDNNTLRIDSRVRLFLPNGSMENDFIEARLGMSEYVLREMKSGAQKNWEMKCRCHLNWAQQKFHPTPPSITQ